LNNLQMLEKMKNEKSRNNSNFCCLSANKNTDDNQAEWSLDKELLNFDGNSWIIRNACEGVMCFGATGSGKSSGPLRKLALAMLENQFGGIVFCVKPDEKAVWEQYADETGRRDDLMYLSKEYFNFLDYEHSRPGEGAGEVENIVHLFMEIAEVGKDKKTKGGNEEYWKDAVKQFLRNAITLLMLADESLTLLNIKKIIDTVPRSAEEIAVAGNYCCSLIELIKQKGNNDNADFVLLSEYFKGEFARLDNRTRSNIISSFTVIVDSFLRGEMKRCFCSEKTTFTPEMTLDGKILIIDYNIKEWQKLGSYASAVIKYCFMKAIERRADGGENARPVFIFADECQNFAIPYDHLFQTTARSSRVVTVYGTQNIGNLQTVYGREEVSSLLGNLGTKIFCQNGDDKTNIWASESIGKVLVKRHTMSQGEGHNLSGAASRSSNSESVNEGWSEQKDFLVEPMSFTSLAKGSKQNKCDVGFILWQSGRVFANGKPFLKTSVKQNCRLICESKKRYKCDIKRWGRGEGKIIRLFGVSEILELILFVFSIIFFLIGYQWIINGNDEILCFIPYKDSYLTWGGVFLLGLPLGILALVNLCVDLFRGGGIKSKESKNKKSLSGSKSVEVEINLIVFYFIGSTLASYHIYKRILYEESFTNPVLLLFFAAVFIKLIIIPWPEFNQDSSL
jgi:type IV secretory system conjugative DNA transfer VirD4/TraG family protein